MINMIFWIAVRCLWLVGFLHLNQRISLFFYVLLCVLCGDISPLSFPLNFSTSIGTRYAGLWNQGSVD